MTSGNKVVVFLGSERISINPIMFVSQSEASELPESEPGDIAITDTIVTDVASDPNTCQSC